MALIPPVLFLLAFLAFSLPAGASERSVFAASSLSEALREVAGDFETGHPHTKILLNLAGSQTLATQIEQGAPADLFISANNRARERLQRQGPVAMQRLLPGTLFAQSVRQDLRPAVTSVKDLSRPW
jgi:molybdate transport system substrate-binding protein